MEHKMNDNRFKVGFSIQMEIKQQGTCVDPDCALKNLWYSVKTCITNKQVMLKHQCKTTETCKPDTDLVVSIFIHSQLLI